MKRDNISIYKGDWKLLIEGLILKCCEQIKARRTTAAIFHILTGKKSIQTVQDTHLYDLALFYGIDKSLRKNTFHELIRHLEQKALISVDESSCFQLTSQGDRWLLEHESRLALNHFNGLSYHALAPVFSERLLLLVQILTNSSMQNYSFIPIVDKKTVQVWVKSFYKTLKWNETTYLHYLHDELHTLLSMLPDKEASIFVDRLTGYRSYGKSMQQLAYRYQIPSMDIKLVWTCIIHRMLSVIQSKPTDYQLLHAIIQDAEQRSFITESAKHTHHLLQRHYSVETIAAMRKLKRNTIYDHIVEIALVDSTFPVSSFVTDEQYNEIIEAIERTKTYSLKQLKDAVADEISYFQIRLVLATIKTKKVKS
ncbi:hypothetical protein GCM10011409_08940 [Lentibacillus populi]|uniref:Helicase Helix-turn-helix domain-containing protein n=1 Tax=Lentibacillus populi TaxID=1827502 RepID=A0A9W5TW80_9BACI|nr:helix-turn-helix domain-containing protein [Lentibacillus populi]GGB33729.1 hypothetical protein GCM10011409_08940 [Lentibacillus populi]